MTDNEALHTAARRYCRERSHYWHQRYAELRPRRYEMDYSDEQKDVFPRYNVLEAILWEVERLRPEQFVSLEDAKEWLALVGMEAQTEFTQPSRGQIETRAMQDEREIFREFVLGFGPDTLALIEPLPFRHALTSEESRALWTRVDVRWETDQTHYWYPLQGSTPPDAIAFHADAFHKNITPRSLQKMLENHGVGRVYELREYGPEYEMDLALLDPFYNGAEGYWTMEALDWLIYASHESTMTVAGAWLVEAVKEHWPAWAEYQVQW